MPSALSFHREAGDHDGLLLRPSQPATVAFHLTCSMSKYTLRCMKLNSTTIQAALISAAVSAFIGLLSIGATIGIGMWQQEKTRVKQTLVERRLEIAQEYYRISYKWPRARFDLATLGQISTELDVYNQGHTLYLDSPGRAMANVLVDAMRDVERSGEYRSQNFKRKFNESPS